MAPHPVTPLTCSPERGSRRGLSGIVFPCDTPVYDVPVTDPTTLWGHERNHHVNCPSCNSANVSIQMVQTGGKNAHKGAGLLGHTNNAARGLTAVSTLGMSNLLWKKSKGTSRQKFSSEKRALCQDCGHDWKVK